MNITVTGGSGTIGRAVVDRLVAAGHRVVSIVKDPLPADAAERRPSQEVVGDAGDPDVVADVLADGMDAVVHLAAIPSPGSLTARELLVANSLTTMTVLEAAAAHDVRHVVIASSMSALGMPWAPGFLHPLYVPIDEDHPLRPAEGYGLSKENDEAAARMAARRWGMTVVALRFPFTQTGDRIARWAREVRLDPTGSAGQKAARELWGYLDVRDAAQAVEKSLLAARDERIAGALVLNVTSGDVLTGSPLEDLLARWHPDVPVTAPLTDGAYPITRARELIGFEPEHLLPRGAD